MSLHIVPRRNGQHEVLFLLQARHFQGTKRRLISKLRRVVFTAQMSQQKPAGSPLCQIGQQIGTGFIGKVPLWKRESGVSEDRDRARFAAFSRHDWTP